MERGVSLLAAVMEQLGRLVLLGRRGFKATLGLLGHKANRGYPAYPVIPALLDSMANPDLPDQQVRLVLLERKENLG